MLECQIFDNQLDMKRRKSQKSAFCSKKALKKGTPDEQIWIGGLEDWRMFNFVRIDKIKFLKG